MVNATVDNSPVSIQLPANGSTTVPTGETWRVTLQGSGLLSINATENHEPNGEEITVVDGDTLEEIGATGGSGIIIQGWVVA